MATNSPRKDDLDEILIDNNHSWRKSKNAITRRTLTKISDQADDEILKLLKNNSEEAYILKIRLKDEFVRKYTKIKRCYQNKHELYYVIKEITPELIRFQPACQICYFRYTDVTKPINLILYELFTKFK